MSEHSKMSPSGASRFLHCTASVAACEGLPDTTNKDAEEGTLAHSFAEFCLTNSVDATPEQAVMYEMINGVEIPEEMIENVNTYIRIVTSMMDGAIYKEVELKVDLSHILGNGEEGTSDLVAVVEIPSTDDPILYELQVHDYKNGRGKVYAEGNEQLILYALGAYEHYTYIKDITIGQIRLVIHQPKLKAVEEWVITIDQLLAYGENFKTIAEKIDAGDVIFDPGEKQCLWCKKSGDCKAQTDYALSFVPDNFKDLTQVSDVDNSHLSELLPQLPFITKWISKVNSVAYGKLMRGEIIEGQKLVEGRMGNRAWEDEKEAERIMKSMRLKLDEMYKKVLISPTVAEKLLSKKVRKWNRIKPLITRVEGKPVMVADIDKRPAINLVSTVDYFDDLTQSCEEIVDEAKVVEFDYNQFLK